MSGGEGGLAVRRAASVPRARTAPGLLDPVARRDLGERNAERPLVLAAPELHLDLTADAGRRDVPAQPGRVPDVVPLEGRDDVADLDPGAGRRPAGGDLGHHDPAVRALPGVDVADGHPEPAPHDP